MKTTLILPDSLMVALKRRAAERGTSLSALAGELLRRGLDEKPQVPYEPNFPVFKNTGPALIDVANRDHIHDVLDAERDARLYGRRLDATRPDATRPDATRPDATRPDATRPDATRPDATRPDATRPDATRPDATRPDEEPGR